MTRISVVVPTCRPTQYRKFLKAWKPLFKKHGVDLITVFDGDTPRVEVTRFSLDPWVIDVTIPYDPVELIFNHSDVVRNLGFFICAFLHPDIIITLDDDTEPCGDTIQDHLDALNMRVDFRWMSTADKSVRGIPYKTREKNPVMLSHGVWHGVADWDAPSQLVKGSPEVFFYKGVVPKGVMFPMCGMNIAFRKELLPYMYFAPMGPKVGIDRFGDIWAGIVAKHEMDKRGWAVVTGYAKVHHRRASNVFKNLQKEAKGIEMNETFYKDFLHSNNPYYKLYRKCYRKWKKLFV